MAAPSLAAQTLTALQAFFEGLLITPNKTQPPSSALSDRFARGKKDTAQFSGCCKAFPASALELPVILSDTKESL
jgi:hypothetical protein